MTILVTGFDPFGDETMNPAWETVRRLPDDILGHPIHKQLLPTSFRRSSTMLEALLRDLKPDITLGIGLAGGRQAISLEKVAINLAEARIPDNDGDQPIDQIILSEGDTAYLSNLPLKAIATRLQETGFPVVISYTAGTFVCNSFLYHLLHLQSRSYPAMKAGFIHVPYCTEQLADKAEGTFSLSLETMVHALESVIRTSIEAVEATSPHEKSLR